MALATRCPHCGTTFRVAADQLKLRGGIVRCGKCSEVFDGNATLIDTDAPREMPVPAAPFAAPEGQAMPSEAPGPAAAAQHEEPEVYTLDFAAAFDPLGILPKPEEEAPGPDLTGQESLPLEFDAEGASAPSPELHAETPPEAPIQPEDEAGSEPEAVSAPEAQAETAPEPAPHAEPDFVLEPEAEPRQDAEHAPEPERVEPAFDLDFSAHHEEEPVAAPAEEPAEAELVPTAQATEPVSYGLAVLPDADEEPGFVVRERRKEKSARTRRILMAAGSLLLVAALLAQAVTTFRNVLAARYPQLKPALTAACGVLDCKVALPMQADALAIDTGELQTIGGDTYSFVTALHNQSTLVQAWPSIELVLTDTADKPVLRRVIGPAEYLPAGTDAARGFAARSDQPVKVYFKLKDLKPSDYHITVFYP
ncbi:MAG: DUF3426 domain-containing protein [Telluria sp.]